MKAPTVHQMVLCASTMVRDVMAGGEKKHGAHIWWERETVRHHVDRAVRHACTAMGIKDGNMPIEDGEDAVAHLDRAIVRLLMAREKVRNGH